MHNFLILLNITLHVLGGLSVHHQESKTVHTASGICTVLDSWWWTEGPFKTWWIWSSLYFGMWRLGVRWVSLRATVWEESASPLFSVEDGDNRLLQNIVRYVGIQICTFARFRNCIIHSLYQILLRRSLNGDSTRRNMRDAWGRW
jgi:hypothetical protein